MITPALPLAGSGSPTVPVPYAANRTIPLAVQPSFGIVANGLIPGTGPQGNAFYQAALQYDNTVQIALLQANQTLDWYGAAIPGLMNLKNNGG